MFVGETTIRTSSAGQLQAHLGKIKASKPTRSRHITHSCLTALIVRTVAQLEGALTQADSLLGLQGLATAAAAADVPRYLPGAYLVHCFVRCTLYTSNHILQGRAVFIPAGSKPRSLDGRKQQQQQ